MISRDGISECAVRMAGETLLAASPMISSDRITAFWRNRHECGFVDSADEVAGITGGQKHIKQKR